MSSLSGVSLISGHSFCSRIYRLLPCVLVGVGAFPDFSGVRPSFRFRWRPRGPPSCPPSGRGCAREGSEAVRPPAPGFACERPWTRLGRSRAGANPGARLDLTRAKTVKRGRQRVEIVTHANSGLPCPPAVRWALLRPAARPGTAHSSLGDATVPRVG